VRGVTVSEASSRASLYMLTLSSALVAYGFLADTHVAAAYLGVVLPIVFVLGIFTWERLVQTALENIIAVAAIQRIRRYYATLLPVRIISFRNPPIGRRSTSCLISAFDRRGLLSCSRRPRQS
jgi:hypothetical protein